MLAKPGSEEEKLIGGLPRVYFLTEDVNRKYDEWRPHGVHFQFPPKEPPWRGTFTLFQDVDGNSFGLAGFDKGRKEMEARRTAFAQQTEIERRNAKELAIAKKVQARLFPQTVPSFPKLDYAGCAFRRARWAATITISLIWVQSAKGAAACHHTREELATSSGGALDSVPVLRECLKRGLA